MSKECVAMILAGGQGSRLGALTKKIAKPAVPYGGKYRIIDFPLSNCIHSNIDTVGVLTQYQPLELNTYIGNGTPWDLDRNAGGVYVLPPYMRAEKGEWYKGTANAIYQNIGFIEQYDPEYVLILSGDHIYKMNYEKMISAHKEKNAVATIAVMSVGWDEASRFGIMNTAKDNRITSFEEKPAKPKSNLASMGVYVFNWKKLKTYLIMDENNDNSVNDFGKNIIPAMLDAGEPMYTYSFEGYWKDVGTIESLWQSNMDLLTVPPKFNQYDKEWKIYSRSAIKPPQYISSDAEVINSCITEGCKIYGKVEHSIISDSVTIGKNTIIKDCIIMPGVVIGENCVIQKSIIADGAIINDDVKIGVTTNPESKYISPMCSNDISVIGAKAFIPKDADIPKNAMVEAYTDADQNDISLKIV